MSVRGGRSSTAATALYVAQRVEMDDRVKEMLAIASNRDIPVLEVTRPELDRMAGFDGVHQGVALKVPPYEYAHPQDLLEQIIDRGETPLLVALDATMTVRGTAGERKVPAEDFFVGVYETAVGEGELLTGITIPARAPGSGDGFSAVTTFVLGWVLLEVGLVGIVRAPFVVEPAEAW